LAFLLGILFLLGCALAVLVLFAKWSDWYDRSPWKAGITGASALLLGPRS